MQILPYLVLQKIMLCDSRSRTCLLFVHAQSAESKSKIKDILIDNTGNDDDDGSNNNDDDDDDDDDDDNDDSSDSEDEDENNISPMDVILALLHCSDNFLQQDLLCKLSLCQFAIPCLLPDHLNEPKFLLFAMRSIIKAWKSLNNGKISYNECRIVDYQTPFITFLKLGNLNVSKSVILNTVISDSSRIIFLTGTVMVAIIKG